MGSLLRPPELLKARAEYSDGRLGLAELRSLEDSAILEVLDLQREAGVDIFTDGEYRRAGWMSDMSDAVEGFVEGGYVLELQGNKGQEVVGSAALAVGARLRQKDRLTAHETAFMKKHSPGPFKITMPSATNFAYLWFKPGLTDRFYTNQSELLQEVSGIVRSELVAATEEGVPYVQLDAPRYTLHVDHDTRQELRDLGV